uniref:GPI alpha-1,4-mannosyltransferase I, catalytic subunit n=1 Tax=Schistocephalus solidus TaxID=70667 RepID=A0A183SE72_SCHSO
LTDGPPSISPRLLRGAILLRLALLVFSVWQDQTRWPDGQLRFTDVDYDVFSDAARAMVRGEDIYEARPTYRYSPLIAGLLAPGYFLLTHCPEQYPLLRAALTYLAVSMGKLLFITADILCALVQCRIISVEGRKYLLTSSRSELPQHTLNWLIGFCWLFNPVTASVSVRGNAESVLGLAVLCCLLCVLQERIFLSGILFGLCIHLKLYPVIYAPIIYLMLCQHRLLIAISTPRRAVEGKSPANIAHHRWKRLLRVILVPCVAHWLFALATLISLGGLTAAGYYFYGWPFLNQAYFYHFTRVDFWHNFAPHFYPIYLFEGILSGAMATPTVYESSLFPLRLLPPALLAWFYDAPTLQRLYTLFKLFTFLPALILVPALAFKLRRRPSMAWFAITFAFVCTSQYFLWWLVLLPSALACVSVPRTEKAPTYTFLRVLGLNTGVVFWALPLLLLWFGGQAGWLLIAYFHEVHGGFWGRFLWLALWLASVLFLLINVYILHRLVGAASPEPSVYVPKVINQPPTQ